MLITGESSDTIVIPNRKVTQLEEYNEYQNTNFKII